MSTFSITQTPSSTRPSVSNNTGRLNTQLFTFAETSFTKGFYDPTGGTYQSVLIKSIPSVLALKLNNVPVIVGDSFLATSSGTLSFVLDNKYAIHNGVLYQFSKDIDLIIADYDALGLKLLANVQGLLTFIDPLNLADIRFVQGIAVANTNLSFTFSVSSSVSGEQSGPAIFSLIPWENVNLKTNYILQSGNQGANPVTGLEVTGTTTKTIKITFNDATFITANFTDIDTVSTVTVVDSNTNLTRHEVAQVEGTSLYETITSLITPTLVGNILTLKYKNENDIEQQVQISLAGLTPTNDIHLDGTPTYNAATNTITITETNGSIFTIDLSEFSIGTTVNPDGTVDITQEGVSKITISKVGISGEYADLKNITDQKLSIITILASELNGVDLTNMSAVRTEVKNWMNTHSTPIVDKEFIAITIENDVVVLIWNDTLTWNDTNIWTA